MSETTTIRELSAKDSARIKCQPPYGETCNNQAVVSDRVGLSFFYHCEEHAHQQPSRFSRPPTQPRDDAAQPPSQTGQHTPTPWAVGDPIGSRLYAGGKLIGDMHQILKYENGVESTDNYEAWANAAFIVRAVNSHAALVEALLEGMGDTDGWKAKAAGALALAEGKGE